jgi:hypothetical protein
MADDEPETKLPEDELEVIDLHPPRARWSGARHRRVGARMWRWLTLGVNLLLLAVLLSRLPLARDALGGLARAPASPTAWPTATPTAAPLALPAPAATAVVTLATPTALPGGPGVPALGPAPASCEGLEPALTHVGPPQAIGAVGHAPVWVGGFTGPYATLRLGSAASANAFGWASSYTQYGWPAPIYLVLQLQLGLAGPVTLSGWDPRDGHPLYFGFVQAGVWGAPTQLVPAFTVDPMHPSVPAGGTDETGSFWYGYIFLPRAGCYRLAATWPGGMWQVTVSAGR